MDEPSAPKKKNKGGRKPKYTCEQVSQALEDYQGVYLAANALGCTARCVYNYIDRHPSVKATWEAIDGETTDYAFISLRSAIMAGEAWAIQFQLRMKGQKRGYIPESRFTTTNQFVDLTKLPNDLLERIVDGEDPASVLQDYEPEE